MEFLIIAALGVGAWFFLRSQSPNDAQTPQALQANQDKLALVAHAMISGPCPTSDQIKQFQHYWNLVALDPSHRLGETGIWDAPTEYVFQQFTGVDLSPCFASNTATPAPLYPMSQPVYSSPAPTQGVYTPPATPYNAPLPTSQPAPAPSYMIPQGGVVDSSQTTAQANTQPTVVQASPAQPTPVQLAQPTSFIRMTR